MPTELLTDAEVARDLGIPVHELLATEAAKTHREPGARNRGAWDAAAVVAVRAVLVPGLLSAPPAVEPKTERAVLVVASRPLPNASLLACVGEGGDPNDRTHWVLVKVRTNVNFLPKMKIRAERVEGAAHWRYLGRDEAPEGQIRYPRGRGVW